VPTNKSSAGAGRKPIDKPAAWAATVTNLVVLPGLGSLALGWKVGYAQAALGVCGFTLSLASVVLYTRLWMELGELPQTIEWQLLLGLAGLLVFGMGWFWALMSSLKAHRMADAARTHSPGGPPRLAPPVQPPAPPKA
jgi:Kef-type K+ transport system membrane component KefB